MKISCREARQFIPHGVRMIYRALLGWYTRLRRDDIPRFGADDIPSRWLGWDTASRMIYNASRWLIRRLF